MAAKTETAEKTVTMDLPRARVVHGVAYGPGEGVEVPESVAKVLTAQAEQGKKSRRQGRGRAAKTE